FATKWAIAFTVPSHLLSDRVRLQGRNATSTVRATASHQTPDLAHEAGFSASSAAFQSRGLASRRGTLRGLVAPIAESHPGFSEQDPCRVRAELEIGRFPLNRPGSGSSGRAPGSSTRGTDRVDNTTALKLSREGPGWGSTGPSTTSLHPTSGSA